MKLDVLLDADVLGRRRTGDESYVEALLQELPAAAPELRLAAVTRHPERVPAGVEAVQLDARSQLLRMGFRLPLALRRLQPAVLHTLYVLPPGFSGRSVVTVHDISFERHPELMAPRDRFLFRRYVPRSARRADRILTGSEWTKRELVERYRLEPEKVVVTPYGVDAAFRPEGPRPDRSPYALFVGAIQPRKDPVAAVEALALVDGDLGLVLVGPDKRGGGAVAEAMARTGLQKRVEAVGHVEREQLAALYRGAACLVFPSRYEGFGLPVLEAMASGTPVVASNAGSLPEVAGEAAVLVEPGDPAALAAGIARALSERPRLVAAGLDRVRRFSWAECALRTAAVYRELL